MAAGAPCGDGAAGTEAVAAAVQKFAEENDGTFAASSLSIELDDGSYTVVIDGYWSHDWYVDTYFTYTMTGNYTVSGSTITLGEPAVSILYHGTGSISATGTSHTDGDSVSASKKIFANMSLTYSSGSLVIDFSALDDLADDGAE